MTVSSNRCAFNLQNPSPGLLVHLGLKHLDWDDTPVSFTAEVQGAAWCFPGDAAGREELEARPSLGMGLYGGW